MGNGYQGPRERLSANLKKAFLGTSRMVQWLRSHLPIQGLRVQSLARELRSHTMCGIAKKKSAGLILSRKMRPSFASSPEVRPDFWNSGPRSGLGVPGSSSKDHLSISSARMAEVRQLLPPTPFLTFWSRGTSEQTAWPSPGLG